MVYLVRVPAFVCKHNGDGTEPRISTSESFCLKITSGCRCGEGYTPPEAYLGARLTAAADVYQLGGLCYFMALGCDPPGLGQHNRGPAGTPH